MTVLKNKISKREKSSKDHWGEKKFKHESKIHSDRFPCLSFWTFGNFLADRRIFFIQSPSNIFLKINLFRKNNHKKILFLNLKSCHYHLMGVISFFFLFEKNSSCWIDSLSSWKYLPFKNFFHESQVFRYLTLIKNFKTEESINCSHFPRNPSFLILEGNKSVWWHSWKSAFERKGHFNFLSFKIISFSSFLLRYSIFKMAFS